MIIFDQFFQYECGKSNEFMKNGSNLDASSWSRVLKYKKKQVLTKKKTPDFVWNSTEINVFLLEFRYFGQQMIIFDQILLYKQEKSNEFMKNCPDLAASS
jgi:hypothetical protein